MDVLTSIGDVSDYAYMEQLFSQSEARFGGVDILVNNAGISHIGLLEDMTIDEWNRIIGVNLTSVFSASKLALPHMIRQKSGKILNISSIWGNVGASWRGRILRLQGRHQFLHPRPRQGTRSE